MEYGPGDSQGGNIGETTFLFTRASSVIKRFPGSGGHHGVNPVAKPSNCCSMAARLLSDDDLARIARARRRGFGGMIEACLHRDVDAVTVTFRFRL